MIITRKLRYDAPAMHIDGIDVSLETQLKILGIIVESKLTFN